MQYCNRVHFHVLRLFFFSSRRRHTRLVSDWSSDVCSSNLVGPPGFSNGEIEAADLNIDGNGVPYIAYLSESDQIGRASCRERV